MRLHANRRTLAYLLTALPAVGSIFWLPFHTPRGGPVRSDSYVYGFANSVSTLSVVAFAGIFCAIGYATRGVRTADPAGVFAGPPPAADEKVSGRRVFALLALAVAPVFYFYFIRRRTYFYGEAYYYIKILLLMRVGKVPYADFEYAYGPALVYPTYLIDRLLQPWGASAKTSYCAYCLLASGAGVLLLARVVNRLNVTAAAKNLIFVLVGLIAWNEWVGVAYGFMRYLTPVACVVEINALLLPRLAAPGANRLARHALAAAVSAAAVIACMSLSPEIGLAALAGLVAFWVYLARVASPLYLVAAASTAAAFAAALLLIWPSYLTSVYSFGKGGNNFPVVPSANILIYLGTVFFAVPLQLRGTLSRTSEPTRAIDVALAAVTLALVPGALGRCDPVHTFFYGLVPLIVTCAAASRLSRPLRNGLFASLAVVFFLYKASTFALLTGPRVVPPRLIAAVHEFRAAHPNAPLPGGASRPAPPAAPSAPVPYADLAAAGRIGTPFGCDYNLMAFLLSRGGYEYGYFHDSVNLFTPAQLRRKLSDVDRCDSVLVPAEVAGDPAFTFEPSPPARRRYVGLLLLFPIRLQERNAPLAVDDQILAHVRAEFPLKARFQGYYLLSRARPGVGDAAPKGPDAGKKKGARANSRGMKRGRS